MWARGLNDEIIVWRYFHCDHPPGERTASELQKQTYRWPLRASKTNAQMGPTSFRNKRTEGPYELRKETHRWALRASVKRIDGGSLIVWPSFLPPSHHNGLPITMTKWQKHFSHLLSWSLTHIPFGLAAMGLHAGFFTGIVYIKWVSRKQSENIK